MAALFNRKPKAQPTPEELPEVLQELLGQMQQERAALEGLLERVHGAASQAAPIEQGIEQVLQRQQQINERLEHAEQQAQRLGDLSGQVEALGGGIRELEQARETTVQQLRGVADDVADVSSVASGVRDSLEQALRLKADLEQLAGPSGAVTQLQQQADELREQFLNYQHDVAVTRETQDGLQRGQDEIRSSYEDVGSLASRFKQGMDAASSQLAALEASLAEVAKIEQRAVRTEEQLQQLSALSDHVAHKTRTLESQREAVDRAAAQAARLDDLVWDLDARLKKLQEDSKLIRKTQDSLTDLERLFQQAKSRVQQMKSTEADSRRDAEDLARRLAGLDAQVREGLGRLDLERQGLDAMGQQVTELRVTLTDFESRVQQMEHTGQAVAQAQSRSDELGARLTTLAAEVGRVDEQAERVRTVEGGLERSEAKASDLQQRLEQILESLPALGELQSDVTALRASTESVRDALGRAEAARGELSRSHETHNEIRRWLADADQQVEALRQKMGAVEGAAQIVEQARRTAETVLAQTDQLSARQEFVDQLEQRLDRLGALSNDVDARMQALEERRASFTDLEARSDALRTRLDDAEKRFEAVARRDEEVGAIEGRMGDLSERLGASEQRLAGVSSGVEDAAARSADLEALAQQVETVGRQLEERESALDQAMAHLERVTIERQGAAQAVQELEEQTRRLTSSLAAAQAQGERITDLAQQLEARADSLRFADKRVTQFEEKIAQLERMQRDVQEAIEGLAARQSSVDAVRGELGKIFETAERTVEHVRVITAARQEVEESRAALEAVLSRAREVDTLAASVDERWSRVTQAEERLARLDAVLGDVRGSLETLRGQQTLVDHAIEKASQLQYQAKEAEAIITALREERELASRIHDAVQELRQEDKAG